jgi:pilus assembly protein Flp/PilA
MESDSMTNFIASAKKFMTSEDGPTMVEYGLLVALIAIVAAAAAATVGTNVKALFTAVAGSV